MFGCDHFCINTIGLQYSLSVSMEGSQIVTVESTNTSYSDNTNSYFRVRLPQTLNFDKAYELGLLDVSIPATVHNVQADAYFALALYGQPPKLLPEDNNSARQTVTESGSAGRRSARELQAPFIQAFVKFHIQRGYYTSVDDLLDVISEEGRHILEHQALTAQYKLSEKRHNDFDTVNKLISSSSPGLYISDAFVKTISTGFFKIMSGGVSTTSYNLKSIIADIFTTTLARCHFKSHTGLLRVYPVKRGSKESRITSSLHFSQDIAFILGQPAKTSFYLPETLKKSLFSEFLCRLQPTDTIYLYCPQIMESIVSDIKTPILKILAFSARKLGFGDMYHQSFKNPIYIELNTRRLSELTFELRGVTGKPIAFLNSTHPVRLTLNIREK